MNKSQELEVQVLRAEISADETVKQHLVAWYGEEVEEVEQVEQIEEEEDGDR